MPHILPERCDHHIHHQSHRGQHISDSMSLCPRGTHSDDLLSEGLEDICSSTKALSCHRGYCSVCHVHTPSVTDERDSCKETLHFHLYPSLVSPLSPHTYTGSLPPSLLPPSPAAASELQQQWNSRCKAIAFLTGCCLFSYSGWWAMSCGL